MTSARQHTNPQGVLSQIATLVGGSLAAQIIAFVAQLGIARLYTDETLGYLGIYTSVATLAASIAAGRYDLSIVLPERDAQARALLRLSMRLIVATSLLTSGAALVAFPWVAGTYGRTLALALCAAGASVFFLSGGQALSYWLTRRGRFCVLASSSVVRAASIAFLQLGCGWISAGAIIPLIGATIVGQGLAWAFLYTRTRDAREADAAPVSVGEVARQWRKMAFVGTPNVLVDALRVSGINILIAAFAVDVLGQFQLAWMVLQAPVALIAGALSQVYVKRMAEAPIGSLTPMVRRVLLAALGLALPTFALLAWSAPALFPLLFGPGWEQAGLFARSLCPWLALNVATAPLSNVFVVAHRQGTMLAFACLYCAFPLTWLALSPLGAQETIAILGAGMALLLALLIALTLWVSRSYDRGEKREAITAS